MMEVATSLFLGWLSLATLGVLNGIAREVLLVPRLGALALPTSGFVLAILILIATLALRTVQPESTGPWTTGGTWLALTVFFEFALGRLRGSSWATLCQAYKCADGNLWPLVLLTMLIAPRLADMVLGR